MCLNKTGDGYGEEAGPLSIIDGLEFGCAATNSPATPCHFLNFPLRGAEGSRREASIEQIRSNSDNISALELVQKSVIVRLFLGHQKTFKDHDGNLPNSAVP